MVTFFLFQYYFKVLFSEGQLSFSRPPLRFCFIHGLFCFRSFFANFHSGLYGHLILFIEYLIIRNMVDDKIFSFFIKLFHLFCILAMFSLPSSLPISSPLFLFPQNNIFILENFHAFIQCILVI